MEGAEEKKRKVPAVPETLKKKRKNFAELKIKRLRKKFAQKMLRKARRKLIYEKAKHYHKEYRQMYRTEIRMARMARKASNFYVPVEPKLAFVIRIRGLNGVSPKVQKVLQLPRLRQIFNSTFVKLNKASINMLRTVEPYIACGYPNLKSVNELIYKRGYGKINKKRISLTDNALIARSLGKYGIICMEDLIHEIYTVGKHFKEANNFLWPFKLSSPRGGMKKKTTHFVEGCSFNITSSRDLPSHPREELEVLAVPDVAPDAAQWSDGGNGRALPPAIACLRLPGFSTPLVQGVSGLAHSLCGVDFS
ncbi:hypothetical protein R6Z07M_014597 [Ovis aries]